MTGRLLKSVMDRAGAAIALVLLSPVFVIIMMKVKKDGGPAFYGHTRLGQGGKPFRCWKFRSMVLDSQDLLTELLANDPAAREEWKKDFKLRNDPRVTKIGKVLRKTSLDELPQLFNVLMGEMSLVGPRPIVDAEKKYYGDQINAYLSVKPGMTGLWQVSGRNDTSYEQRVRLDNLYVSRWSIWNDLSIIFKTFFVVLSKAGAY